MADRRINKIHVVVRTSTIIVAWAGEEQDTWQTEGVNTLSRNGHSEFFNCLIKSYFIDYYHFSSLFDAILTQEVTIKYNSHCCFYTYYTNTIINSQSTMWSEMCSLSTWCKQDVLL